MVDLGGYVIILVETRDKKIKLYGEFLLFSRLFKKKKNCVTQVGQTCVRKELQGSYFYLVEE